ncbi:hypothetical protein [Limoniibacter endophyticus]|uniref:Uncharacterized protein n=1 Tax=Limoniibacter endophyticus TaxID=1565040 RepID=A0A8J3DNB5_9HYPH|nr:hypothetical protein [Limoniibacter endophyticus]GHC73615.1 hypothetical protein GCM10010136_21860 [Limoniibacter endophyticus]
MERVLPPLHEGHAPIALQEAFKNAVEAFENWNIYEDEPSVPIDQKNVPVSSVFGRMRTCTDIVPETVFAPAKDVLGEHGDDLAYGVTYDQLAAVLRTRCVERLRHVS